MELPDGTILPNFLGTRSGPGRSGFRRSQVDFALRMGRIVAAHAPTEDGSTSGQFWEYDVEAEVFADNGSYSRITYPRCQLMDKLGGVADHENWTPRIGAQAKDSNSVPPDTMVFIMCVNGNTKHAVIVGGPKHPGSANDNPEEGHHYTWEFNGVVMSVNSDGEFQILHRSPTNPDGTLVEDDDDTNSTFIRLSKEGDVILSTGAEQDNVVTLNSKDKKIVVNATQGDVEVAAKGNVKIDSAGVLTGDATDNQLLGTTFRNQQQLMHTTLMPLLTALQGLITTAGVGLSAAGVAHLIPVAGPIIGAPAVTSAAVALTTAGPLFQQMFMAFQSFEQQAQSYLSTKNKHD